MATKSLMDRAEEYIPAEVRMFAGCRDEQTSADVSNVESFGLQTTRKAGGACTTAMLQILYADEEDTGKHYTFKEVLLQMRDKLAKKEFTQVPQLSSSRPMKLNIPFTIVPESFNGTRRALMIGINYIGQKAELTGCQNDIKNMAEYIKKCHGFTDGDITFLLDDGKAKAPTKANIMAAFRTLASKSMPGDALFFHFAGHGGTMKDLNGDEEDGYDETLVPVDYVKAGQICDDDIFKTFICEIPKGVTLTCVVDCCHSGTALDLPFVFKGGADQKIVDDHNLVFPHMASSKAIQAKAKIRRKLSKVLEEVPWVLAIIAAFVAPFFIIKG